MIAAFFDCDGTLYSSQFGRGLLQYASDNGGDKAVRNYYAALLLPYLMRRARLISQETFQRPLIGKLARLVKGWDVQESRAGFGWVVHEYLLQSRHPEVVERLHDHQVRGHMVVLISGVFVPALKILGEELGVSELIGTRLEENLGNFTGRIIPPVVSGREKVAQLYDHLSEGQTEIDWAASYAYADSVTDEALLRLVGNPVAVYPDTRLLEISLENGWEVMGSPKAY
ncbi:MAG TPA: HAD-IB family hydrolase [Anaerolineales bacterium]|nr:HAD-IB family hydrolase [Anaerolineales bacterium]